MKERCKKRNEVKGGCAHSSINDVNCHTETVNIRLLSVTLLFKDLGSNPTYSSIEEYNQQNEYFKKDRSQKKTKQECLNDRI
jgi:hypothetical protein